LEKTKIVCTVGPASRSEDIFRRMHRAGMNGVKINTACGTIDPYESMIETIRKVADVPIIVHIKGPEIRLRGKRSRMVKKGDVLEAGFKNETISFRRNFMDDVEVGDNILVDNGKLRLRVAAEKKSMLRLVAVTSGRIDDEGTILFTAASRTSRKHASNLIKTQHQGVRRIRNRMTCARRSFAEQDDCWEEQT
jgi:pyruvate kinase